MSGARKRRAKKDRDELGRFKPGSSGNPKGRPRKPIEAPKLLTTQLAEAMAMKIPVTRAGGKQEMRSAYELAAEALVRSLATAKPKEIIATLEWMERLQVFSVMRENAMPKSSPELTDDDWIMLARIKAVRLALHSNEEALPDEGPFEELERKQRKAAALQKALSIGREPEKSDDRAGKGVRKRPRNGPCA